MDRQDDRVGFSAMEIYTLKTVRPRQYGEDYASRFKNRSLAEAYELRPPYPEETHKILLSLLGESRGRVLDVGCGTGKIARSLVNHVDGVDAVDFSQEMIQVGKSLSNGNHPKLRWIIGPIEDVQLYPPYRMVTAGASVHWMEWNVVFPKFKKVLTTDGYLVIIDGDRPVGAPWQEAELSLIRKYSTNKHYEEIDLVQVLADRGHIHLIGDKRTAPVNFSQPLIDYVQSFHSRASMSKEDMGESNVSAFDTELSQILSNFVDVDGFLSFQLETRVTWGRPLC